MIQYKSFCFRGILVLLILLSLNACSLNKTTTHACSTPDQIAGEIDSKCDPNPHIHAHDYVILGVNSGYPIPDVVLNFSTELALDSKQIVASKRMISVRNASVAKLLPKLEEYQAKLEHHYLENTLNDDLLAMYLTELSILQTKLDYVYLKAQLQQKQELTTAQIEQYTLLCHR